MVVSSIAQFYLVEKIYTLEYFIQDFTSGACSCSSYLVCSNRSDLQASNSANDACEVPSRFVIDFVVGKLKNILKHYYAKLARRYDATVFSYEQLGCDKEALEADDWSAGAWATNLIRHYAEKCCRFEKAFGADIPTGLKAIKTRYTLRRELLTGLSVTNPTKEPPGTKPNRTMQLIRLAQEVDTYRFLQKYFYYKKPTRKNGTRKSSKKSDKMHLLGLSTNRPVLCLVCMKVIVAKMLKYHTESRKHRFWKEKYPLDKDLFSMEALEKYSASRIYKKYKYKVRRILSENRQVGKVSACRPRRCASKRNTPAIKYACEICREGFATTAAYSTHFTKQRHQRRLEEYGVGDAKRYNGIFSLAGLYKMIDIEKDLNFGNEECEDDEGNVYDTKTYHDLIDNGLI